MAPNAAVVRAVQVACAVLVRSSADSDLHTAPAATLYWSAIRSTLAVGLAVAATLACRQAVRAAGPPNVVLIVIDDMGYGDLPSFGNADPVDMPALSSLAAAGIQFRQFYASSPLCSPSRVGVLTGQYPSRWRINSYLSSRAENKLRDTADFLSLQAPTLARAFGRHGYATAHFGKWHLGGGRDVGDAPLPTAYGFEESFTQFEGLGDRALIRGQGLARASAKLGQGQITWVDSKNENSALYVDKAIDFIDRHRDRPFYMNLWPEDVHDPYDPRPELAAKYAERGIDDPALRDYYATMEGLDRELGRLFAAIDDAGLAERTVVVVMSDNGPTAAGVYYDAASGDDEAPGSTGGLRGRKSSLYEGGIRSPLVVRWKGRIPAGKVNRTTVVAATDLYPSLLAMAGVDAAAEPRLDGVDLSERLLGDSERPRETALYWDYGRNRHHIRPFLPVDRSPNLAMRKGDLKLLLNADGTHMELYDLGVDPKESTNLVAQHPDIAEAMSRELLAWREAQPSEPAAREDAP